MKGFASDLVLKQRHKVGKLTSTPLHKELRSMEHSPRFCCKLDKSKLCCVLSLGMLYKIRCSLFLVTPDM